MKDVPDEVTDTIFALYEKWAEEETDGLVVGAALWGVLHLHRRGLILWASELRDEATIARAARGVCGTEHHNPKTAPCNVSLIQARAALSAVLGSEEPLDQDAVTAEDYWREHTGRQA